jgi:hypothetical protein
LLVDTFFQSPGKTNSDSFSLRKAVLAIGKDDPNDFIREVRSSVTSCAAQIVQSKEDNNQETVSAQSIAITINTSKFTYQRLCALISFISAQEKQIKMTNPHYHVDLTIFTDDEDLVAQKQVCDDSNLKAYLWEKESGHNR